ncbi:MULTISPECIES: DUF3570 domain-containing protein [unclassified Saccharicrinis]|uniref:DUF3570 domain-containing protein n=1 Tax=unclassified Saccharicrinis TaxID=2646859 RepID=UPI003D34C892
MKRKYLLIGSLALAQFWARAQGHDRVREETVKKTEIELVFNHYRQDGDHSAVTGGAGTEELTVYGPMAKIKHFSGKYIVSYQLGSDIITSASTDKIDFVESSASRVDGRTYANVGYERIIDKHKMNVYGGTGFSIESDYFSLGGNIGFTKQDKEMLKTYSVEFQYFNDDLRWGRLKGSGFKPQKLLYPAELRHKEWYDVYRRMSYNLKLGYTRIINARNVLAIFPGFTYQEGLLATTFHRVYFSDGSVVVEKLPQHRYKSAIALRLNTFAYGFVIFKNTVNGYSDSFGISAISVDHETAFKIKPLLTLLANARFYTQNGSPYFNKMGQHRGDEKFYTSDYDYSDFETYRIGTGLRYHPSKYLREKIKFNALLIRYNFNYRTDGMKAHVFSLVIQAGFEKAKNHGF